MKKYLFLLKTSIKNNLVYRKDFIISNFFLILMLIIYIFLWKKIYISKPLISNYTFNQLIWYLIINQIVFLGNGPLFREISSDIKSGDIAYHLNKPYNYLNYIFFKFLGRNLLMFLFNFLFGIISGVILVGIPHYIKISYIPFILVLMFLGIILNLLIYITIALTAFWFEENKAFFSLYQQLIFSLGGFLIPINFFPTILQKIDFYMPWTYVSFHISNTCVNFNIENFVNTFLWQILYIIIFSFIISILYKKGMNSLDVNGG